MMDTLFSFLFLSCCGVASYLVVRGTPLRQRSYGRLPSFLGSAVVFLSVFFGTFLALGYVTLFSGIGVVNSFYAAVLSIVILLAVVACQKCWGSARLSLHLARTPCVRQGVRLPGNGVARYLAMLAAVVFGLIALMVAAVGFPRGYEVAAYHLPIAIHIFQTQSLGVWDEAFVHTLPANASILYGFLMTFLPERFVSLGHVPFLPVLLLTVYGIARRAAADESASVLASLGVLTIPVIAIPAFMADGDTAGLTLLTVAVYFIVSSELPPLRYAVAGLAMGLAFGFKLFHLMGGLFLFLAVGLQAWIGTSEAPIRRSFTAAARSMAMFGLPMLLMASFWLVRNYVELGNPLYPVHLGPAFDVLGWREAPDYAALLDIQHHWVRSSLEWLVYPWIEWHYAGLYYNNNAGLGAFFAATVPVAFLFVLLDTVRRLKNREGKRSLEVRFILICGVLFILACWWVLGNRQPRYASAALLLLLPLVAVTLSSTTGRARGAYEGVVAICILWMFFVFFSREFVEFGDRFIYSKHYRRHQYYEYPPAVDRLRPGSTIINFSGRDQNFSLFGSSHQNQVISLMRSVSTFGIEPSLEWGLSLEEATKGVRLSGPLLKDLKVTHVYLASHVRMFLDDCVTLREIDRLDRNPVNQVPLDPPKILYAIEYCSE